MSEDTTYRQQRARPKAHRRVGRRAGGWASRQFLETLSRAGRLHPRSDPGKHGVEVVQNLSYACPGPRQNSRTHKLDIYRPTDTGADLPVVLYIHGGAFQVLSKDTHWIMGLSFARRGFLVVSINYRLAPRYKFPAAVQDVSQAYQWTVEHAAEYGGDPDRILVAGESAGANLACSLAVMTSFDRPEPWARDAFAAGPGLVASLPACGLLQVSDTHRFERRRPMSRFVHDQIESCEIAYLRGAAPGPGGTDLADPLLVLESDVAPARPIPPHFALVGTRDPLLDDTRRLEAALLRRGVPVQARYYPGGPHAFHALPMLPNARRAWSDQFRFLAEVLAGPDADLSDIRLPHQAGEVELIPDHDEWFA